jgi:hypothetical protein
MMEEHLAFDPPFNNNDIRMLQYFWNQKSNLAYWSDFEKRKAAIRRRHPEVIKAWEDLKHAELCLTLIIDSLQEEDDE